jgi:lipooligosaccharide transport system ATP-binding protein
VTQSPRGPAAAPAPGSRPDQLSSLELVAYASGLRKAYGAFEAVRGIDFSIARGQFFGFLGPNGAGKTSTMRMLQAGSPRSGGQLRVLGLDPGRDGKRIRARLGVCAQENNLDPDLSVVDNLLVYGSYFPQSRREIRARADALLDFVALSEKRKRAIKELSGGMKRRLMLARALINEPELVILDEPTTGLDPQARHLIWQKLRQLKDRGATMILTTHYMDEAERLCDQLVIMDRGRVLANASPRHLIEEHVGHEVVEVRCAAEQEAALLEGLELDGVQSERAGDVRAFFFPRHSRLAERIVERAHAAEMACLLRNATLEDVFLKLTGHELSE